MKKSIIARILITIAAVLILTDAGLLAIGFSTVYSTVQSTYISYAMASTTVAADLLEGVDLEKLQAEEGYADYYRTVLEDLCRTNDLEYLYVYTPDMEENTITFRMVIYGQNSQVSAAEERVPGTVIPYTLTESEVCAWKGQKAENVEEMDNKYGHVLTAYSAVHDSNGRIMALVAADVSTDEAFQTFFRRYRIMFMVVSVSFVIVLIALAVLLKARVLKPAAIISRQMRQYAADRGSGIERIEFKGEDEFAQMADAFYHMTEEIDDYIKNINVLTEEKHRREAEISIAGRIQKGLLPDENFHGKDITLRAVMIPANDVGGDFYDYFCLPGGLVCTVIADVSGKGISAALFMASAITAIRQYAKMGYTPAEILFHTNHTMCSNNPEQMFLTLFVGIYNSRTRKYVYANGGHNPPYLISGALRSLDDSRGVAAGIFEEETYEEREVVLKEGDAVFLYTDGVNEAVSRNREFFGVERLEHILAEEEPQQCVEAVLEAVREFAQDAVQSDDITMLSFYVPADFRISVEAVLENLSDVQEFILGNERLPDHLKKKLCLAAEEIFVNICSYAYGQERGSVEISMKISDKIRLEFRDSGMAFNPLEDPVDVEEYDMDNQVGGLGRLIAFDLADRVDYVYSDGNNILTLIFNKEESI